MEWSHGNMKSQVNLFEFDYKDSREKYSPKELGGSTLQLAKEQGSLFCLPSQTEHSQISLEVSFSAKWEFLFKKSMVTGSYFLA